MAYVWLCLLTDGEMLSVYLSKRWSRRIGMRGSQGIRKKDRDGERGGGRGTECPVSEFQNVIIFSPDLLAHWFQQPLI